MGRKFNSKRTRSNSPEIELPDRGPGLYIYTVIFCTCIVPTFSL